jgi:hypothetical protein
MKLTPLASNMTELRLEDGTTVLFSYQTPVACLTYTGDNCEYTYYKTDKQWSRTTSKHINKWLDGVDEIELKPQVFFDSLVGGV